MGTELVRRLVPDVADQEVYLCGPESFMDGAAATVRTLGVPAGRVHQERFFD